MSKDHDERGSRGTSGSALRLKLPFLGQRSYLQGTTLFDALIADLPAGSSVSYKFSHMIRSDQVEITDLPAAPERPEGFPVTLSWQHAEQRGWRGVTPLPASPAIERRPYPEEQVTDVAIFSECQASFRGVSIFSFVGTLVSLHKALLLRNKIGQGRGQWVFTRLDVEAVPTSFGELGVQIEHVLGHRLVKSRVLVNGLSRGVIFFSWLAAAGE